jgi:curli biogenesis system outer membrane secretion channel CsgG
MRRVSMLLCLLLVFSLNSNAQKKRIAVMNFDYGTVRGTVSSIFGTDQDIGKGVADLLVNKLVKDGVYSVIERKELDKVLAEQNVSNSNRADPGTAAKIGRVLGVDAIVVGSITQFGRDDKSNTIGGGALGGLSGRFGVGGIQRRNAKAVVGLSARMVDVNTAEVLAVADGKGESRRSGASLVGAGGGGGSAAGGGYDMTSSNFGQTILGEAVHDAVNSVAADLDQNAQRLPTHVVTVDGLVADVTGSSVTLNVGTRAGVKIGDHLQIVRKVKDIKDPATGAVIRSIENKLGEVTITEADEVSSVGNFSGSAVPKIGDKAKSAQ